MSIERIQRTFRGVVPLAEVKHHARAEADYFDAELERMAASAVAEAEDFAQIALFRQTVRILLPKWPRGHVQLPIAPVLDPASVKIFIDTVPWTDFHLGNGLRPLLAICGCPPSGVIVIEYQAGFGSTPDDIPDDLRQAIIDQAAVYFDARGTGGGRNISLSPHFTRILARYRGVRA